MKTKLKIAFVLLLMLCIAVSGFAGGSSSGSSSGTSSGTSAASTAPVRIELWYGLSMSESPPPPANWKVLEMIRQQLNIELVLTNLPTSENDSTTRIMAAASANQLPDIFQVGRTPWQNLIRMGLVGDVTDLYALMPTRTANMHGPEARAFTTVNGRNYGFAAVSSIAKNEGFVIRKDWLDRLNLQVPRTTDELFAVMRAFTFNDPDGNGRNDTYGFSAFLEAAAPHSYALSPRFDPILGAFGVAGVWDLSNANAGLQIRKPAYFDALTYIRRMVTEGVIDPNWVSITKDDFRAQWKQGRFGIMREQFAALSSESNYRPFDTNFPNGEWIVIDPPRGPQGLSSVGVFPTGYRMWAVSAKAISDGKGPAIARLLEWMSTTGYTWIGWGEEGVNWVRDPATGAPTSAGLPDAQKWDNANVVSITQLRNMVFYNSEMEVIARYPSYRTANGRTMNMLSILAQMQSKPWTPNDGAQTLPIPSADVQRFYEQGIIEFVTGQRELTQANWTAWKAEFDRVGGKAWEDAAIAHARTNGYLY